MKELMSPGFLIPVNLLFIFFFTFFAIYLHGLASVYSIYFKNSK